LRGAWHHLVIMTAVLAASLRPLVGVADDRPRLLASLADGDVVESSGLARSGRDPELLWTINDSGNEPVLFATDRAGQARGRVVISGATNVDWEDLAAGQRGDGEPMLVIGDIGDNGRSRDGIVLYRVSEPAVNPADPAPIEEPLASAPVERFPLAYPDGAHDAETLLISPRGDEILIVTKDKLEPAGVYRVPQTMTPGVVATLEFAGLLALPGLPFGVGLVTGGAVSIAGDRLVVRTYGAMFEWRVEPDQTLADALVAIPVRRSLAGTGRGEAIAYGDDGGTLLMTAEGSPCPLFELPPKP